MEKELKKMRANAKALDNGRELAQRDKDEKKPSKEKKEDKKTSHPFHESFFKFGSVRENKKPKEEESPVRQLGVEELLAK